MTWTHLHLALNHVPVIGILIVLPLLTAGLFRRSAELQRASWWLLLVLSGVTVVVYFTGEPAEELVENMPGFSEPLVERHEQAALVATIGIGLLGLIALGGLIRRQSRTWYPAAALLVGIAVAGLMAWTANLGGQIRHPEIRAAAQSVGSSEP